MRPLRELFLHLFMKSNVASEGVDVPHHGIVLFEEFFGLFGLVVKFSRQRVVL